MGIVPDSISLSPKLLTSLKDFDDDDKRLDAAYQRQVGHALVRVKKVMYLWPNDVGEVVVTSQCGQFGSQIVAHAVARAFDVEVNSGSTL